MTGVRWKHNYTFSYSKGKVRVTCKPCGKSSRWFDNVAEDEAMKRWCNTHAGLRLKGESRAAPS